MTNKEILGNAPEGATHYWQPRPNRNPRVYMKFRENEWWFYNDFYCCYEPFCGDKPDDIRSLADIKRIVELEEENKRMQVFIRNHCEKWEGVREMKPSIQVLKRCLPKEQGE